MPLAGDELLYRGAGLALCAGDHEQVEGGLTLYVDDDADAAPLVGLLQAVAAYWRADCAIPHYSISGRYEAAAGRWCLHLNPYPAGDDGLRRKLWLLRANMPGVRNGFDSRGRYPGLAAALPTATPPLEAGAGGGADPFCRGAVLARQQLYEGRQVRLLLDHDPVAGDGAVRHFLIVTKRHVERLEGLTSEEFDEAWQLARRLCAHYRAVTPAALEMALLNHNGRAAGQTVPHWHLHLIVVNGPGAVQNTVWNTFLKMMGLSSPLQGDALQEAVAALRCELRDLSSAP